MAMNRRSGATPAFALAIGAATALWSGCAAAQYFGGNKVRYENPDFRVLRSGHFDIYHYEEEAEAVALAAVLAERWNGRLEKVLDHRLQGRQPLILYAGHPHFRQTNATPGEVGEATGGFTEMFKRRIVLPFAGPMRDTDHVLGHELVHAFQFDMATEASRQGGQGRRSAAMRLPLWFIEGMAEYLSLGSKDPNTAMWLRDAVLHDDLPTIRRLNHFRYFPYRFGHAFWAYVAGRWGDDTVGRLLREAGQAGDVERAIRRVLETDTKTLSKDWHAALREEFGPQIGAAQPAGELGRVLLEARSRRGRLNVSPSLSPDGRRLLFFSERDQFSIELYLLDVGSGEVIRRLTRTVTDPHYDSLQFLSSAGAWSPDGRRIAIGGVSRGRPVLTILDTETGNSLAEYRFTELVEVLHPAWSPDGRRIAFSANAGGFMNLYLLDLESGAHRPLTRGRHTAIQPAWSPDGRSLAFVTDRFTTDLEQLVFGEFRLARLDPETGAVTALPHLHNGKHINPQWSPDGAHLYFLSDTSGTTNLYRLVLASGRFEQLTDLQTGISGISRLSPALSVAAKAPLRIAVSVFARGMYHIHQLDRVEPRPPAPAQAGILPPRERADDLVDSLLASPVIEARAVQTEGPDRYRARMTVDYAAQPNLVVGASSAGTFVGGGIALFWSDMLGDHNLMTLLQAEGEGETIWRNTAAVVSYDNRKHRWNWGAAGGQIPSRSIGFQRDTGTFNGEPAERFLLIRQWQINRELAGRVAYPFTRADRFEFSAGYRHISFIFDAREQIFSTNTGELLADRIVDLPSPDSLDLYPAGIAYVHDSSVFGGTAPALGTRARIELSGLSGDLSYYSPLLDVRHYLLPYPYLTIAGRILHFGRYGGDAEDTRLRPLYLGSPGLVRGYTTWSFRIDECEPTATSSCPVIDQLFGTRLAVASVEARTPIFGARGLVHSPQAPPVDFALFYDTGVAWTRDDPARFLGGSRDYISSYGAGLRLNLFGLLVLQWNYVQPVDRPRRDWYVEFIIAPGF